MSVCVYVCAHACLDKVKKAIPEKLEETNDKIFLINKNHYRREKSKKKKN